MLRFFATWAVIGFVMVLLFPKLALSKLKKWQAIPVLILSGPICWALFTLVSIELFMLPPNTMHEEND